MKVSLAQIAEKTGISKSMVSRAMRNYPEISEKTRKKILTTALKMGYKPSEQLSRSGMLLSKSGIDPDKTKKYNTLNIIFYRIQRNEIAMNNYFALLLSSLYLALKKSHTTLLESYPQNIDEYLNILDATRADGTIILGNVHLIDETLNAKLGLYAKEKVLIFLSSYIAKSENQFHSVRADNIYAGSIAAEYLLEKTDGPLLFLDPETGNPIFDDRYFGYKKVVEEKIGLSAERISLKKLNTLSSEKALTFLKADKNPAFIGATDLVCFKYRDILMQKGIWDALKSAPMICIDGTRDYEPDDPRIASVCIDLNAMADQAAKLFTAVSENPDLPPQRLLVGCRIQKREI